MESIPEIEKKYVVDSYNKIANSFSETRYKAWPSTVRFIQSLPVNSKVLEVGCGNGKNMLVRDDVQIQGCDISNELI